MIIRKPVEFRGSALDDLRAFPVSARREAGHQLDQVQQGLQPDDWKPMPSIGSGAQEIRVRDAAGAFRVIYVAKFSAAIYVLHCFQKKTPKTSRADVELARQRYRDYVLHCFQKKTPKTSRADVELARQRYRDLVKELNR